MGFFLFFPDCGMYDHMLTCIDRCIIDSILYTSGAMKLEQVQSCFPEQVCVRKVIKFCSSSNFWKMNHRPR